MNFAETYNIHWVVTPVEGKHDETTRWSSLRVQTGRERENPKRSYKVLRAEHKETFKRHSFFLPLQRSFQQLDAVVRHDRNPPGRYWETVHLCLSRLNLAHLKWWWKCKSVRRGLTRRSQDRHWKSPILPSTPSPYPSFIFSPRLYKFHSTSELNALLMLIAALYRRPL